MTNSKKKKLLKCGDLYHIYSTDLLKSDPKQNINNRKVAQSEIYSERKSYVQAFTGPKICTSYS
jgi:SET domain-containing protein